MVPERFASRARGDAVILGPWRSAASTVAASRARPRSSRSRRASRASSGSSGRWSPRNYFGAAGPINAFTVAFQVPNLVRALVADAALSVAFVPVFSELLEKGEAKRAWRVASSLFWLMLLGLSGLTALFIVIAPWIIRHLRRPRRRPRARDRPLARPLPDRRAARDVRDRRRDPARATSSSRSPRWRRCSGTWRSSPGSCSASRRRTREEQKLYVYAIAIVIGTLVQVLLPMPWLRGADDRLRVVIDWRDPAVKQIFKLMIPVTVGLGLINFNAVVDSRSRRALIDPNLSPTAIEKRVPPLHAPAGDVRRGDRDRALPVALAPRRAAATWTASASTVNARPAADRLHAHPGGRRRGRARAADHADRLPARRRWGRTRRRSRPARSPRSAAGSSSTAAMLMLNRSFFSLQENWMPTVVAGANLVLNAGPRRDLLPLGTWGIPLATTLVNMAGSMVLLTLLQRRVGRLDVGSTLPPDARGPRRALAGLSWFVWRALDEVFGRSLEGQLGSLVPRSRRVGVYLGACRLLGVRELDRSSRSGSAAPDRLEIALGLRQLGAPVLDEAAVDEAEELDRAPAASSAPARRWTAARSSARDLRLERARPSRAPPRPRAGTVAPVQLLPRGPVVDVALVDQLVDRSARRLEDGEHRARAPRAHASTARAPRRARSRAGRGTRRPSAAPPGGGSACRARARARASSSSGSAGEHLGESPRAPRPAATPARAQLRLGPARRRSPARPHARAHLPRERRVVGEPVRAHEEERLRRHLGRDAAPRELAVELPLGLRPRPERAQQEALRRLELERPRDTVRIGHRGALHEPGPLQLLRPRRQPVRRRRGRRVRAPPSSLFQRISVTSGTRGNLSRPRRAQVSDTS